MQSRIAVPASLLWTLTLGCGGGGPTDSSEGPGTQTPTTPGTLSATGTAGTTGTTGTTAPTSSSPATTDPDPATTAPTLTDDPFETESETSSSSSGFGTGFDPDCQTYIDLVFVMDVSTSMDAILEKLEAEIATVDDAIKQLDVGAPITPRYGLVVFVDDTTIINGGAAFTDVAEIQAQFNTWYTFAQGNTQTSGNGTNIDWPENTLDALYLAADTFQWGEIEDTLRLIIHTTDDTFGENPAIQSGVAIQHKYLETVLLLQSREIRVFTFADNDATGGPLNNLDVSAGFFKPYNGNTEIPLATDGGAFNINQVLSNTLSLSAAINESVEMSLCKQYVPQ